MHLWDSLGSRPLVTKIFQSFDHIENELDCPKNALSSQIKNFTLGTTFSHSLGQKQYKKLKVEFFRPFFQPAQAVQSFTT